MGVDGDQLIPHALKQSELFLNASSYEVSRKNASALGRAQTNRRVRLRSPSDEGSDCK